jgi:hypothetical protein
MTMSWRNMAARQKQSRVRFSAFKASRIPRHLHPTLLARCFFASASDKGPTPRFAPHMAETIGVEGNEMEHMAWAN